MPPAASPRAGTEVSDSRVIFRLHDPRRRFASVRVHQDLRRPRNEPVLRRVGRGWEAELPLEGIDRLEYKFEVEHRDGGYEHIIDPSNPARVPGAFGDKSVIELPTYEPPTWVLEDEPLGGEEIATHIHSDILKATVPVRLWATRDAVAGEPLPLLVAHDGSEYQKFSGLLSFLDRLNAAGRVPPMRCALLDPVDRDEHYSASAAYARALASEVLPQIELAAPTPSPEARVGMGASLGGLAMLHSHRTYPETFGALVLQSSSFFRHRFDKHESGHPRYVRISRFVAQTLNRPPSVRVPVVITCGVMEENLENNRLMARSLRNQGYRVHLVENRDLHNFVGWRDTFDPHLADLLNEVAREA